MGNPYQHHMYDSGLVGINSPKLREECVKGRPGRALPRALEVTKEGCCKNRKRHAEYMRQIDGYKLLSEPSIENVGTS